MNNDLYSTVDVFAVQIMELRQKLRDMYVSLQGLDAAASATEVEEVRAMIKENPVFAYNAGPAIFKRLSDSALQLSVGAEQCRLVLARLQFRVKGCEHA